MTSNKEIENGRHRCIIIEEENCYDRCYLDIGVVVCNNVVASLPIFLADVFLGTAKLFLHVLVLFMGVC